MHDSVIGSNKIPLDNFACNLVTCFSVSSQMALGCAGLAHIAILVSILSAWKYDVLILLCSASLHMSTHNSWTDNGLRMKNMTQITPAVQIHLPNALISTTLHSHLGQRRPLLVHVSAGTPLHIHAKHPHPNCKHLPCQHPSKRAVTFGQWSINGSSPTCRQINWALCGHRRGG